MVNIWVFLEIVRIERKILKPLAIYHISKKCFKREEIHNYSEIKGIIWQINSLFIQLSLKNDLWLSQKDWEEMDKIFKRIGVVYQGKAFEWFKKYHNLNLYKKKSGKVKP